MRFWRQIPYAMGRLMEMSPGARLLNLEVAATLLIARVCVAVSSTRLPFKVLDRCCVGRRAEFSSQDAVALSSAIKRSARFLPGTYVCLPQALSACILFRRKGLPLRVFIGVRKGADSEIQVHAWTKSGDFQVTGSCQESDYQVLREW